MRRYIFSFFYLTGLLLSLSSESEDYQLRVDGGEGGRKLLMVNWKDWDERDFGSPSSLLSSRVEDDIETFEISSIPQLLHMQPFSSYRFSIFGLKSYVISKEWHAIVFCPVLRSFSFDWQFIKVWTHFNHESNQGNKERSFLPNPQAKVPRPVHVLRMNKQSPFFIKRKILTYTIITICILQAPIHEYWRRNRIFNIWSTC